MAHKFTIEIAVEGCDLLNRSTLRQVLAKVLDHSTAKEAIADGLAPFSDHDEDLVVTLSLKSEQE